MRVGKFRVSLLKLGTVRFDEPEYEVEPSLLAEADAVYGELKGVFDRYPENKHWREGERRNMLLGWLGEKVFDMTLNQLEIQHVWRHPLIQNMLVKSGKKAGADFLVHGETVDVKVSSSPEKPPFFFINADRVRRDRADFYVFMRFSGDLKSAWISGWLKGEVFSSLPRSSLKYSEGFKVRAGDLLPIRILFDKWSNEEKISEEEGVFINLFGLKIRRPFYRVKPLIILPPPSPVEVKPVGKREMCGEE